MEPFIADFLGNKKIPKALRYLVLAALVGFIEFICISVGISNSYLAGRIVGIAVALLMLAAGIYAAIYRIHKS